jgi:hypothetical protein
MSETNKAPKIFVPGTQIKEFKFNDGGSVLRLSINVAKFAEFVKANKNESGYINFNINARQSVGQFGDTHNLTLDTWKPTKKAETAAPAAKKAAVKKEKPVAPASTENSSEFV